MNVKIPHNWKESPLGQIAKIVTGGTPKTEIKKYWNGNIPFITPTDINTTKYIDNTERYITGNGIGKTRLIPRNSVCVTCIASVGKVCIASTTSLTNQQINALVPDKSFNSEFLYYLLLFNSRILQITAGATTVPIINKAAFSKFIVMMPKSLDEQIQIAKILSVIDDTIEQTDQLIEKYKSIKQGLMQDLFRYGIDENGQIRSETTHKFKDSPLGRIPEEWEVKTIDEISEYVGSGITPTGGQEVYLNDGVMFIRSQNVHFQKLVLEDVVYIDEKTHKKMKRSEIFSNDVLLNITGASIGRCCVLPKDFGRANVNQHVCAIRVKNNNETLGVFLSFFLSTKPGQSQIDILNAGSNRQGLNYQQVRAMKIIWPKEKEKNRINQILAQAEKTIENESIYKQKLLSLKQGLMNDLLTGKVRVNHLIN